MWQTTRGALALVVSLLVCAVLISERANAQLLSYRDIGGKWCTGGGTVQINRHQMEVVRSSDGQRLVFTIQRFEYAAMSITVHWTKLDQKQTSTTYVEFDADRRKMVQLPSDDGPRRELYRC
jgi:hypothetical protein